MGFGNSSSGIRLNVRNGIGARRTLVSPVRWRKAVTAAAGAVLASACTISAADHEVLGDRAYADGEYANALVEYRLALLQEVPDPGLRQKAGAAALRARNLHAAVEEYLALARAGGPDAASLAADGFDRVARFAVESGNQSALAAALSALEQVAPDRSIGEYALQLAREMGGGGSPAEVLSILLHAAAAAPDARLQDSLMFSYAEALRRQQRCAEAIPVLEGLLRRRRDPRILPRARAELAQCALLLGSAGPDQRWRGRVLVVGTPAPQLVLHRA